MLLFIRSITKIDCNFRITQLLSTHSWWLQMLGTNWGDDLLLYRARARVLAGCRWDATLHVLPRLPPADLMFCEALYHVELKQFLNY